MCPYALEHRARCTEALGGEELHSCGRTAGPRVALAGSVPGAGWQSVSTVSRACLPVSGPPPRVASCRCSSSGCAVLGAICLVFVRGATLRVLGVWRWSYRPACFLLLFDAGLGISGGIALSLREGQFIILFLVTVAVVYLLGACQHGRVSAGSQSCSRDISQVTACRA